MGKLTRVLHQLRHLPVLYSNDGSFRFLNTVDGNVSASSPITGATSSDAASCLPTPVVTLACTLSSLVDSAGNVSVCTVTSSAPALVGGISVALQLPVASSRYSTSCTNPLVIQEGDTTAQCTITATPNTVGGDGTVSAVLTLLPGSGYTLGAVSSVTVAVNDDDPRPPVAPATPVPLGGLPVGVGIVAAAWALLRRRRVE